MHTQKKSKAHSVTKSTGTGHCPRTFVRMVNIELLFKPSSAPAVQAAQGKIAIFRRLERSRGSKTHPFVEASNIVQRSFAYE